jgi:hypothetical protein
MGKRVGIAAASYFLLIVLLCIGVNRYVALAADPSHPRVVVASVWRGGELVVRRVMREGERDPAIDETTGSPGSELVMETIVAEGPVLARPGFALALSLVSGHDGLVARLDGATTVLTPDDLLAHKAYDHGVRILGLDLPFGTDTEVVLALLAERMHASAQRIQQEAALRRIRVVRTTPLREEPPWAHVDSRSLSVEIVRNAALDAARYLARNVRDDGHFRYLVEATTDRELAGYDWPRHAGVTYFLAQAADHFHDPELATACLRGAALMRDHAVARCGEAPCIGDEPTVDVGSSALGLLAFAEIARTGLDPTYSDLVVGLARFLRAQQRADGEFMHEFDRTALRPIDVQYVYYSGEAALALSRAHRLTQDSADLAAATSALAHLVGPAWRFFGDRYFFSEEHWTCQAMADLWERAPNPVALDFCARWQAYNRRLQYRAGETVYDADGAIGIGPVATPRLTPVASRCEAGLATLGVLERERPTADIAEIDEQQRRALALLVRRQLRPGPIALFPDPDRVYGAMPGSEVDLALRIDYAQHAGSAMLRWVDLKTPR